MKRIVILSLFSVVFLGIAGFYWADSIARIAVEKGASFALGVPATLDSMSIGLFSGQAGLKGFTVKNPPGFSGAHFLRLGSGDVGVSLGSLLSDRVVVPKIHLRGIDLSLEQSDSGTNLMAILGHLDRGEGSSPTSQTPSSTPPDSETPGKRFVVEEILIEDIRVSGTLNVPGLGPKTLAYQVPQIRLQNVGSDSSNGASLAKLSAEIVKAILKGAIQEGKDLPQEILQEWKAKKDSLRDAIREQGDDLKNLFRKKKD